MKRYGKRIKQYLAISIVLLIVCFIVFLQMRPNEVETALVESKTTELYFSEKGEVKPGKIVDVYPMATGQVLEVLVEENQEVNEGDIICRLDPSDYQTKIRQAESVINSYRAQIDNLHVEESRYKNELLASRNDLQAQMKALNVKKETTLVSLDEQLKIQYIIIEQCEKDLQTAKDNLSRMSILYDAGAISKKEYEDAQAACDDALASLDKNTAQSLIIHSGDAGSSQELIDAQKEAIQAQLNGLNNSINLSYSESMTDYYTALIVTETINIEVLNKTIRDCVITAPISGVITYLPVKESNVVMGGTPIATINSVADNHIEVLVNTNDIDNIVIGQQVELTLRRRDGDKNLSGRIISMDSVAVVKISSKGSEERLVKTTIQPDNQDEFRIGYDVDVKFIFYSENNQLVIPKTAVFKEDEADMVWAVNNGKLVKTEIELGVSLRQEVTIKSGLTEGSLVVADGSAAGLKDGMKVR